MHFSPQVWPSLVFLLLIKVIWAWHENFKTIEKLKAKDNLPITSLYPSFIIVWFISFHFFQTHILAAIKCLCLYTLTYQNILKNKLDVYNVLNSVFPLNSTILYAVMQKNIHSSYRLHIFFPYMELKTVPLTGIQGISSFSLLWTVLYLSSCTSILVESISFKLLQVALRSRMALTSHM